MYRRSIPDDELGRCKSELKDLDCHLRITMMRVEALRVSLDTAKKAHLRLQKRRQEMLNKANNAARVRNRVYLPVEILSYIFALAYDPQSMFNSDIVPHVPPATRIWNYKLRKTVDISMFAR